MDSYRLTYSDIRGTDETLIANDGEVLRTTIRGVEFVGKDFRSLTVVDETSPDKLARFTLDRNVLCSCRIECTVPITIDDHGNASQGTLLVKLVLGDPEPDGALDSEELQITLKCDHGEFEGSGFSGWFEDELIEIQSKLPNGVFIKACINCLYSDYSPYGHGVFGSMMCFRNLKTDYLRVRAKDDFWAMHDLYEKMVQETYLCPEFERRVPGTGYRG